MCEITIFAWNEKNRWYESEIVLNQHIEVGIWRRQVSLLNQESKNQGLINENAARVFNPVQQSGLFTRAWANEKRPAN